jgi:hypothetical protein
MTHFFESTENIFKYFLFHLAALVGALTLRPAPLCVALLFTACEQRSLAVYTRFLGAVNFFEKRYRVIWPATKSQHPRDS